MKTQRQLVAIVLATLSTLPLLQAQAPADFPKHQLGVDLSSIYHAAELPNFIYKRHGAVGAFRLQAATRLDINFSQLTSDPPVGYRRNSEIDLTLRPGYERGKWWGKIRFFYGADLYLGLNYRNSDGVQETAYNSSSIEVTNSILRLGGGPVAGLNWHPLPRFSIGGEIFGLGVINFYHVSRDLRQESTDPVTGQVTVDESKEALSSKKWNISLNPLPKINLNVHF